MKIPQDGNRANRYGHVAVVHGHVWRTVCSVCATGAQFGQPLFLCTCEMVKVKGRKGANTTHFFRGLSVVYSSMFKSILVTVQYQYSTYPSYLCFSRERHC
jgi:hypothetical protein